MRPDSLTPSKWQLESWVGLSGWWRWGAIIFIVLLLGLFALLTYIKGGTATVYPYFILIPVLLGSCVFGIKGGLICGLAAGLMNGPMMPLDVAAGIAQSQSNWLTRVGIYVFLGGFTGSLFTRLSSHSRKLLHQAYTDTVSGLPNRQSLQQQVTTLMAAGNGATQPPRAFVISIQLQNYQSTVSALGFSAERPLLRDMAERLRQVAESLAAEIYHINDAHFAILLEGCSRHQCLLTTRAAIATLQKPFNVHGIPVYLGAHAGVASYPFHEREDPGRLITKAWLAMYEASEAGRNYATHRRQDDATSLLTVQLLGELQSAIEKNQLILHYQPKVDVRDGRLVGVEALVRWQHPEHGLIPPGDFIPQAERTGLIHPLTRWVLKAAIREMAPLQNKGARVTFSINVSARNFLDPDFVSDVLGMVARAGLQPGELALEFTETAVMTNPEAVVNRLLRLTKAGITLAIDDFGTGHSSLLYLKRLPVTVLKIDQSFVRDMSHNPSDAAITRASIGLAKNLGMKTVAEGVEDAETLDLLASMGCDTAQGYGIARPMPAAAMLSWALQRAARFESNQQQALNQ